MRDPDRTVPDAAAWELIQPVFEEALNIAEGDRGEFVRERCAKNPLVQTEVESLLACCEGGEEELVPSGFPAGHLSDSWTSLPADVFPGYERRAALAKENQAPSEDAPHTSGQVNDLVVEFLQAAIAAAGDPPSSAL